MSRFTTLLAVAALAATAGLQLACSDSHAPSQPAQSTAATSDGNTVPSYDLANAGTLRRVEILDACEPESFNLVFGRGFCIRDGGRTLQSLLYEVGAKGESDAWRFAPGIIEARVGQLLLAVNNGGETHTFTEVKEFGGGINPLLNELSHNPAVAPECPTAAPLAAGASTTDELDEEGTELYQCCIHPWMRTKVVVKRS